MGLQNTSALVVIVAALLLAFFYIRPALVSIGELQDKIFVLKENADKATEVNARLQEFQNEISSLRQSDVRSLETYLPTSIDMLQVMHDIETIANTAGLALLEVSVNETENEGLTQPADLESLDLTEDERTVFESLLEVDHTDVSVTVTGSYTSFKQFLELLARNHYPLDIVSLRFGESSERGGVENTDTQSTYSFVLRTYAFNYLRNR